MDEPTRGDYAANANRIIPINAAQDKATHSQFDELHNQLRDQINLLELDVTTMCGKLSPVVDSENLGAQLEKAKSQDIEIAEARSAHASQIKEAIRRINEIRGVIAALNATVEV